ncbi:hypothetical protein V1477_020313 [Vespula maculifrons]|uniref:Uncharacterized protein n=2 Tax=Vespula TaxID=7451 RepID=A0A834K9Q0_VESVU|nr:hypothetical protein HZH66_005025 [Vespula vulgaris]
MLRRSQQVVVVDVVEATVYGIRRNATGIECITQRNGTEAEAENSSIKNLRQELVVVSSNGSGIMQQRHRKRSSSWLPQDTGAPPPAQKDTTPFLWYATVRLIITFTISSSSLLFLIFSQTIP